jgi:hypothetical protein
VKEKVRIAINHLRVVWLLAFLISLFPLTVTWIVLWVLHCPIWWIWIAEILFWALISLSLCALLDGWETKKKAIIIRLAETLDQPMEKAYLIDCWKQGFKQAGYCILTYDTIYFFLTNRETDLWKVDKMVLEKLYCFSISKKDGYHLHIADSFRAEFYRSSEDHFRIQSSSLRWLAYYMDRDGWDLSGKQIASYLHNYVSSL